MHAALSPIADASNATYARYMIDAACMHASNNNRLAFSCMHARLLHFILSMQHTALLYKLYVISSPI